jgi:fermentation-respiration switch protein FrsA (DUF1100 family)
MMRYLSLIASCSTLLTVVTLSAPLACSDGKATSYENPEGGRESPGKPNLPDGSDLDGSGDSSVSGDSKTNPSGSKKDQEGEGIDGEASSDEEPQDPSLKGSYAFTSYTQGLQNGSYASAIVYYPKGFPKNKKTAAVTLSGGYTNTKEQMTWIAEHLASHGIVVIAFTPTNNLTTDPAIWSRGHTGAFQKIQEESKRSGSPINNLVDSSKIGIMGFSMGGAGTLLAMDQLSGQAGAAIALCPYQPKVPTAKTPLLFVTGTADRTAVPTAVVASFEATSTGAPKALKNIQGMGHADIIRTATYRKELARSITSWLGLYLLKNSRYRKLLDNRDLKIED